MNNHFAKFALLGVVIAVVLFSRAAYPALTGGAATTTSGASGSGGTADAASQVPLFVLPPIAVSADSANAASAPRTTTKTAVVQQGATSPPNLNDAATLVMDLANGSVVEATNPNRRWPTASLAKLMSATIVLDKLPTSTAITVTNEMFAADPDEHNLVAGGRYTVEDLLHAMLLPSSNVAAQANADFYGLNNFLAEMNARAAAWGMTSTHYDDPSGISAGDESTADDLAKLAQVIYKDYPEILSVSDTPYYYITNLTTGQKTLLHSVDQFAGKPGYVGGKDGYTPQADGNHLAVFQSGARPPVLVIVLGSSSRFNDTQLLYDWFKANFK